MLRHQRNSNHNPCDSGANVLSFDGFVFGNRSKVNRKKEKKNSFHFCSLTGISDSLS